MQQIDIILIYRPTWQRVVGTFVGQPVLFGGEVVELAAIRAGLRS